MLGRNSSEDGGVAGGSSPRTQAVQQLLLEPTAGLQTLESADAVRQDEAESEELGTDSGWNAAGHDAVDAHAALEEGWIGDGDIAEGRAHPQDEDSGWNEMVEGDGGSQHGDMQSLYNVPSETVLAREHGPETLPPLPDLALAQRAAQNVLAMEPWCPKQLAAPQLLHPDRSEGAAGALVEEPPSTADLPVLLQCCTPDLPALVPSRVSIAHASTSGDGLVGEQLGSSTNASAATQAAGSRLRRELYVVGVPQGCGCLRIHVLPGMQGRVFAQEGQELPATAAPAEQQRRRALQQDAEQASAGQVAAPRQAEWAHAAVVHMQPDGAQTQHVLLLYGRPDALTGNPPAPCISGVTAAVAGEVLLSRSHTQQGSTTLSFEVPFHTKRLNTIFMVPPPDADAMEAATTMARAASERAQLSSEEHACVVVVAVQDQTTAVHYGDRWLRFSDTVTTIAMPGASEYEEVEGLSLLRQLQLRSVDGNVQQFQLELHRESKAMADHLQQHVAMHQAQLEQLRPQLPSAALTDALTAQVRRSMQACMGAPWPWVPLLDYAHLQQKPKPAERSAADAHEVRQRADVALAKFAEMSDASIDWEQVEEVLQQLKEYKPQDIHVSSHIASLVKNVSGIDLSAWANTLAPPPAEPAVADTSSAAGSADRNSAIPPVTEAGSEQLDAADGDGQSSVDSVPSDDSDVGRGDGSAASPDMPAKQQAGAAAAADDRQEADRDAAVDDDGLGTSAPGDAEPVELEGQDRPQGGDLVANPDTQAVEEASADEDAVGVEDAEQAEEDAGTDEDTVVEERPESAAHAAGSIDGGTGKAGPEDDAVEEVEPLSASSQQELAQAELTDLQEEEEEEEGGGEQVEDGGALGKARRLLHETFYSIASMDGALRALMQPQGGFQWKPEKQSARSSSRSTEDQPRAGSSGSEHRAGAGERRSGHVEAHSRKADVGKATAHRHGKDSAEKKRGASGSGDRGSSGQPQPQPQLVPIKMQGPRHDEAGNVIIPQMKKSGDAFLDPPLLKAQESSSSSQARPSEAAAARSQPEPDWQVLNQHTEEATGSSQAGFSQAASIAARKTGAGATEEMGGNLAAKDLSPEERQMWQASRQASSPHRSKSSGLSQFRWKAGAGAEAARVNAAVEEKPSAWERLDAGEEARNTGYDEAALEEGEQQQKQHRESFFSFGLDAEQQQEPQQAAQADSSSGQDTADTTTSTGTPVPAMGARIAKEILSSIQLRPGLEGLKDDLKLALSPIPAFSARWQAVLSAKGSAGSRHKSKRQRKQGSTAQDTLAYCLQSLESCQASRSLAEKQLEGMTHLQARLRASLKCLTIGGGPGVPKPCSTLRDSTETRVLNSRLASSAQIPSLPEWLRPLASVGGHSASGLHFRSCAVVGKHSSLLASEEHGAAIDRHEAVFRIDLAPTAGYERFAGSRTDFRVMDLAAMLEAMQPGAVLSRLGVRPGTEHILLWDYAAFLPSSKSWRPFGEDGKPGVLDHTLLRAFEQVVGARSLSVLAPELLQWQADVFFATLSAGAQLGAVPSASDGGSKTPRAMGSGVHAALLASRLCQRVSLFGFPASPQGPRQPPTGSSLYATYYGGDAQLSKLQEATLLQYNALAETQFLQLLHLAGHSTVCSAA